MNGPDHYLEAERLLDEGHRTVDRYLVAEAQVHATLALAAATARPAVHAWIGDEDTTDRDWTAAVAR